MAGWANRCFVMTPHQKRRFPEKVDFITSAGFLSGRAERQAAGVRGGGPLLIVTNLGIMEPDESGELILTALHPGCTFEQVQENTGWPIRAAGEVRVTEPVEENELRILRDELDPGGIYLKGG
jgi:glutaconate CoA-transferase subunit B